MKNREWVLIKDANATARSLGLKSGQEILIRAGKKRMAKVIIE